MAEVEISYKGSAIAQMNASGTKTLLTEGKYLEDDVTVTYARPSAPSGTKNISITANGTTTEDVTNYASAQITANVPNTYAAADEGKVVSNGALVAQGSDTVTENDTYDTTLISSLTVNVSGGGVTFAPMDYPCKFHNNKGSTVAFNRVLYNATTMLNATNANITSGSTGTYNNMLTDGTHIWFTANGSIQNIQYNGANVTYVSANSRTNFMLTLPDGYDGTYTFELIF